MRFRYVAAAALSVALLAGCSATTSGTAQPIRVNDASTPSGSVTTTTATTTAAAEPARVPVTIEGSTGDYLDTLAQNTLDAAVTFWDEQGYMTDPIVYRVWYSSKGQLSPKCGGGHSSAGMFCNFTKGKKTDILAWDKTYLGSLVNDPTVGATVAPIVLLGHEYGHAIQAATGHYTDNPNAELQADCLAGIFARHAMPNMSDEFLGTALMPIYRDPSDPSNKDIITSRTLAFSQGWTHHATVAVCNSYTGS